MISPARSHLTFSTVQNALCTHTQRSVLLSSLVVKVATVGTEGELGRSSVQPLVAIYVTCAVSAIQTHYEVLALCTEHT
jgi:hypothetical protein